MNKCKWKQIGSAVIAAALMGSMMLPVTSYAQGEIVQLQKGTTSQTNTEPEQVVLNNYSGASRTENFNNNWKFYLGEAGSAQTPAFDDSGWNRVTLPHDYSIDQPYNRKLDGESGYLPGGTGWYRKSFTVDEKLKDKRIRIDFGGVYMNATIYLNGEQLGTHPYGYTPFSFDITDHVKFGQENVIAVKVEHRTPSSRFYSGSGIYRDVDLVVTDAVHVDKNGTKVETPDLKDHADGNNVTVNVKTTIVNDSAENANVTVKHTIMPKGESTVVGTVTTSAATVNANSSANVDATFKANGVALWSTKSPKMYTVKTEVMKDEKVVDTYETDYGFRFFEFNNNTGFSLNGQNMKLKGVCMHHDQGALGSVANDRATERQVEILKKMGCNSIRVTHNPASDELIEACNKHGILLIEEAFDGWVKHKNNNSQDYATWFNEPIESGNQIMGKTDGMTWAQFDLTAMIKRGQNDPAIIMWSLGNEMWEGTSGYSGDFKTAQTNLIQWAKALDTTRPVTTGDNKLKGRDPFANKLAGDLHAAKGTVGLNYASGSMFDEIHQKHPEWLMYASETASAINSRGIYKGTGNQVDYGDHDLTSYDTSTVNWGEVASSAWYEVVKRDFMAGEYVWTGFDYIGEPTPWNDPYGIEGGKHWPMPKNSYFGIIDTAGLPKDSFYFYQSQWNDEVNTLHILPAWNEDVVYKDRSGNVPVVVYSDAKSVELWFQDAQGGEPQKIGERKTFDTVTTKDAGYTYQIYNGSDKSRTEHENLYLKWMVPYKDGKIFAKAFDAEGREITTNLQGRTSVTTAGPAKKLDVKADRTTITADGQDLSYITVSITDEKGNLVPNAETKITFDVSGDGVLAGIDNGRPIDHQSYRDNNRKAFSGQLVGIVRSTKAAGTITVKVQAEGMEPQTLTIQTEATAGNTESAKAISSVLMPKNYYVKVGNRPQLPAELEVTFTDGTTGKATVAWNTIAEDQFNKAGTFSVSGTLTAAGVDKKETVYVNINMIDDVAAILNYSDTTPVGVAPTLPTSRPAIMADGTVLTASFPVEWTQPKSGYDTAGVVEIPGTANVFGQDMPVKATIRVQEAKVTVGENIAKEAMTLTQDIAQKDQSDKLEAIRDGKREVTNVSSGPNTSMWSNFDNTKNNQDKDAEITFTYATKQNFNQIKLFFKQDGYAASYPDANTTQIFVSDTGEAGSWTKVNATETIAQQEKDNVKEYTYDFAPVGAVVVKLRVVNNSTRTTGSGFTCTAIAEAELYQAKTGDFVVNNSAKLASLSVDGHEAPASALEAGSWASPAKTAKNVTAAGADNASVTVLPLSGETLRLIIESEDHKTRNTFAVNLDADATNDAHDYDVAKMTYTTADFYPGNELAKAFDKDENSFWHTNWKKADPAERWIEMTLEEPQMLSGLRYLPRPAGGGFNGNVKDFKIEVKTAEGDEWKTVEVTPGTSQWSKACEWKLAKFAAPVEAKYVRFTGVNTYDDQSSNKHMNAAEIRLKVAEETPEPTVAALAIKEMPKKTVYTEGEKFDPTGLVLTVKYSDDSTVEAVYGKDEGFTFEPGLDAALTTEHTKVTVTYAEHKADITITVKEKVVAEAIEVVSAPFKMQYNEGDKFNPAGLEIVVKYSDGTTSAPIVYGTANAGEFTIQPDLNTALTVGEHKATVTYMGLSAQLGTITVKAQTPDEPQKPSEPQTPDETQKPSEPQKPTKPSTVPNGNGAAQTGDNFNVALIATIVVLSGAAVAVIAWIMIKKGKKTAR